MPSRRYVAPAKDDPRRSGPFDASAVMVMQVAVGRRRRGRWVEPEIVEVWPRA